MVVGARFPRPTAAQAMTNSIQRHPLGLTWVETSGMRRAAHALRADGRLWLIDPFEDEVALSAATELGSPAAVIQLLDRHNRDCGPIAQRLEVPLLRVPDAVSDSPFTVLPVISRPWWREKALWWESERALVIAEAVGTAPAFTLGRRVGIHPMLRLRPPKGALTDLLPGAAARRARRCARIRCGGGHRRRARRVTLGYPPVAAEAALARTWHLSSLPDLGGNGVRVIWYLGRNTNVLTQ